MYHEEGIRQPAIAAQLNISQPRVSRLLREAVRRGIVRTVVVLPQSVHSELEDRLRRRYDLRDVVVVDTQESARNVIPALAAAAADYFDATFAGGDVIGVSSWSETLLATVDRMQPKTSQVAECVIQLVGGVGSPEAQVRATRLLGRLAEIARARPVSVALGVAAVQQSHIFEDIAVDHRHGTGRRGVFDGAHRV